MRNFHMHTKLRLEDYDGHRYFELIDPFVATYGEYTLECPRGMLTDGGSIPRFFWRVIGSPFCGKYRNATPFHDGGYTGDLIMTHNFERAGYDKAFIDRMFYDMMVQLGVSRYRAWVMWKVVSKKGKGQW